MGLGIAAVAGEALIIVLGLVAIVSVQAIGKRSNVTIGVAIFLVVIFSWSYFPTRPIYQYFCQHQAGESIFQRAAAKSYLLVGEGGDKYDGLGFLTALDDLLAKKVAFVEIQKLPENQLQYLSMVHFVPTNRQGWQKPGVFRFWISDARPNKECESSNSNKAVNSRLKPNECLAVSETEKADSRYVVELFQRSPIPLIPITHFGVRIEDRQSGQEMAVISVFEHIPRPFFTMLFGDKDVWCPASRLRRQPRMTQLLPDVLFTAN
jgi:hypothetical protein